MQKTISRLLNLSKRNRRHFTIILTTSPIGVLAFTPSLANRSRRCKSSAKRWRAAIGFPLTGCLAIQASARPELFVRQPVGQAETLLPLLIGLHGNGDNATNTLESWSGITDHNWLLAIPQSSQLEQPGAYVWDDRERGESEIREHLVQLTREHAIDSGRVVLGGFSMGGGQAIWMALHQSIKTPGF